MTVEHLLSLGSYECIWQIPNHQRPYSWNVSRKNDDPGQVEEFYFDIKQADENQYAHSLGTIDTTLGADVPLKWKNQGPREIKTYETLVVNDGQQRLTTIFLAYSAICEIQKRRGDLSYRERISADPNISPDASNSFRLVHENDNRDLQFRLHLQIDELNTTLWRLIRDGDDYAFTRTPANITLLEEDLGLQTQENSKPANRLIGAYVYFREEFGKLTVAELSSWIESFYQSEISYIVSETPPHLMFETRNARGLEVSGLDIVKNWMMYAEDEWRTAGHAIGSEPATKWWKALAHMDEGGVYDEKALLGHVRTIIHGSSIGGSEKDASAFKRRYPIPQLSNNPNSRRSEFKEFVAAMEWVAKAMKEVYAPNSDGIPVGSFAEHMNNRGMTGSQEAEALVNLINISCRMDRTGVANTIVILTYQDLSPQDWVRV